MLWELALAMQRGSVWVLCKRQKAAGSVVGDGVSRWQNQIASYTALEQAAAVRHALTLTLFDMLRVPQVVVVVTVMLFAPSTQCM